jgi:prepilin-type N-terminal cleavage/methylation domain-containing protein
MSNRVSSLRRSIKTLWSQRGLTLAELMIALVVSAFIVTGASALFSNMIIRTASDQDKTMAALQVQYVGFWVGEDVVQAQTIELSDPEGIGFPLTARWVEWDGDENRITYEVEGMADGVLWQLKRTQELKPRGEADWIDYGTTIVGEYLVPGMVGTDFCASEGLPEGTWCAYCPGNDTAIVKLKVTAVVDTAEASAVYEINPRALK